MKTKLLSLLLTLATFASQAQIYINLGSSANAGDGDSLRTAGITINTNFFALFASNAQAYATETTRNAAVSNAAVAFAMALSNTLYTAETSRNAAVSNAAVAFSMQASNDVYTAETTRNAAVSNAAVAFSMTVSNAVYTSETTRNAAVSNACVAFVMTTSNTLYTALSSIGITNYSLLNAGQMIITNTLDRIEWSMGANTNGVIPWGATNSIVYTPSNTFTITMSGTPPTGLSREIDVLIINTNSANGYFPTNDLNGGTVYMLPAPSTNRYKFNWKGGRFWISSGQQAETGTNAYMRTRTGVRRTMIIDASYFVTNGLDQAATPTTYTSASNKKPMNALYFDTGLTNAGFSLSMPPEWDRNDVTLVPVWTCTNGSGNVVFQFATDFTDNDDTLDGAFGSNVNSIDTVLAANDTHVGPSATPTFGNSASTVYGNLSVRLRRTRDHASDTLDAGVFLLRVLLQYTESTTEPAAIP